MQDIIDWNPRVVIIGPANIKENSSNITWTLTVLGFLSPLEDNGLLYKVDTYCGVSVGAIISLLIIAGYKIREIVGETCKSHIFDKKTNSSPTSYQSNEPSRQRLIELILNKLGSVPTLYELYMKTGKALITTTLNITDEITQYMGPFTHPNMSCIDAVMYSRNIPFLYYQLMDGQGKIYVDGALGNPYPVDYFDDGKTNILGLYIKKPYSTIFDKRTDYELCILDQRIRDNISKSSNCCYHIAMYTKDCTQLNTKEKACMLVDGYNIGYQFIENLKNKENIKNNRSMEKYSYPKYYIQA